MADAGQSLYFERLDAQGVASIFRLELSEGASPVRLPGALHGVRPVMSPDAGVVLFNAADPTDALATPVLWALELPGGNARMLSPDVAAVEIEATFSPDGTEVVFTSQRDDPGGDIIRARFSDAGLLDRRNLTATSLVPDRTPAWSRDGQRIAFTSYRSGRPRLWVMNVDGSGAYELAPSAGDWGDFSPDWSPDGVTIAFHRVEGAQTRIGLVPLDGGDPVLFDRPGRRTYDARFSGDGTVIAAWERADAGEDVVLLTLDGGVLRVIDTGGSDRHPSWR